MADINNINEEVVALDEEKELNSILQIRRDKLTALKDAGNDPFQKVYVNLCFYLFHGCLVHLQWQFDFHPASSKEC